VLLPTLELVLAAAAAAACGHSTTNCCQLLHLHPALLLLLLFELHPHPVLLLMMMMTMLPFSCPKSSSLCRFQQLQQQHLDRQFHRAWWLAHHQLPLRVLLQQHCSLRHCHQ
jgi:hypothetical protein